MNKDNAYTDEIDLKEIFKIIWNGKKVIILFTALVLFIAAPITLLQPDIYKSSALLMPSEKTSNYDNLMSSYSGLAQLAGVSLPDAGSDKASIAIKVLNSREFFSNLLKKKEFLPELLGTKFYDKTTEDLVYDPKIYDKQNNVWVRKNWPESKRIPSTQEAFRYWKKNTFFVKEDKATGFVTIEIKHHSPKFAKQLVDWVIFEINSTLREKDVEEANRSIEYLTLEVERTSSSELRYLLHQLIQKNTETKMLAYARPEYIFKVIDPAVIEEQKSEPQRGLILILSLVSALLFSIILVLFRKFIFYT